MKKTMAIIVAVAMCFLMCACDPSWFSIDRESLNNVVSVELIEYAIEFIAKENTISRFNKLQKQILKYGYSTRDMS